MPKLIKNIISPNTKSDIISGATGFDGDAQPFRFGWDRNLEEVPPLVFSLTGGTATESQMQSAYYVDSGGGLGINTDLALAAGASSDATWQTRFLDLPALNPRFHIWTIGEYERTYNSGDGGARQRFAGYTRDVSNTTIKVGSNTSTLSMFDITSGNNVFWRAWSDFSFSSFSTSQGFRFATSWRPRSLTIGSNQNHGIGFESFSTGAFSTSTGGGDQYEERKFGDGLPASDIWMDIALILIRFGGTASRISGILHSFEVVGVTHPDYDPHPFK